MKSLQARISVGTGLAVVSAVAILSGVAARSTYRSAVDAASAQALETARLQAMTVRADVEGALDSARNIANMLAAVKRTSNAQPLSREQVIAMLEEVSRRNPRFLGVYTAWEPDAFDGQDAKYPGQKGHDKSGRFLPYLVHGQNGDVSLEPLMDLESQDLGSTGVRKGEYYLCSKESGAECVLNPYFYEIQGRQVLMTSVIAPIMVDGRFQGIAGVDIAVDTLQTRVDEADLGGTADRLAIISDSGNLIAARGRKELDGKAAREYNPALRLDGLKGKDAVSRAEGDLLALATATFGTAKQKWSLAILVPYDKATAGARGLVRNQVIIGLVTAAISVALVVILLAGRIKKALQSAVDTLKQSSAQVALSAREIAASSRTLAEGSSEQAASLEETSASTTEINAMAGRNAADATAASKLVEKSQSSIEETHDKLRQMVDSISAITESSNKISKIISAIDGIAFQTNILALNAAVEAARAGEAGMGFAVVADEVRNLAQRCAQSARETAVLIEESIEKANEGRSKVESVVQSVHSFTAHSVDLKRLVEGVAMGSQEQARGVDQISRAVHDMEGATQRVAAGAEEFAAATREIEDQVTGVERVVAQLEEMVEGHRRER